MFKSVSRGRLVFSAHAALIVAVASAASLYSCASASAVGDVNREHCSAAETSPGFRSDLPDCRAFELVSPAFGGGQPAEGYPSAPLMSANGEHVIALSFAGMCGTEELEENEGGFGALYEFSRTADGWTCEALDPPASEYPHRLFDFASTDLSKSLWELLAPAHSGEEHVLEGGQYAGYALAVREAAGDGKGRFTVLGSVVAPGHKEPVTEVNRSEYKVADASNDLRHVLVSVAAVDKNLWPGDTTVENHEYRSLYEYGGLVGNEPVLVGVRNVGPLVGVPINAHAELISQCGTAANAISAGGETVYFTAEHVAGCPGVQPPVNELYARINGASTVKVSGSGAAVFRGSSEDGMEVFYTEGERLYEYNFAAPEAERVTLLATEVASVAAIPRDGSRVYFTSLGKVTSGPNANGEAASEVAGEKLYLINARPSATPAFVAGEPGPAETTADGEFLAFPSTRDLKGTDDSSTVAQVFEYDAAAGTIVRVSAGQRSPTGFECPTTRSSEEGYDCDGNTGDFAERSKMVFAGEPGPSTATSGLSLAENGMVVFSSALPLTPQSAQGQPLTGEGGAIVGYAENVYEYREGRVYLISPADEATPLIHAEAEHEFEGSPRLFGVDQSGRDVFFPTTDSLVPEDTDTQSSWYDAREDGGFPASLVLPACQGETCRGSFASPPALAAPSSATVAGGGDLVPTPGGETPKPKTPAEKRAEELVKALKTCRVKHDKRRRASCEKAARRKYAAPHTKTPMKRGK